MNIKHYIFLTLFTLLYSCTKKYEYSEVLENGEVIVEKFTSKNDSTAYFQGFTKFNISKFVIETTPGITMKNLPASFTIKKNGNPININFLDREKTEQNILNQYILDLYKKQEVAATQEDSIKTPTNKQITNEYLKKNKSSFRIVNDEFSETKWFYNKTSPEYLNQNNIFCYFGIKENGTPWLRLRIQYTASNWLFIESYSIKTDNGTYDITTNYGDIKTDHSGGEIWEWIDKAPTAVDYIMLRDIANSKDATIRHNGKQYRKDRTITAAEKKALNYLLDSFEALGGEKPRYN